MNVLGIIPARAGSKRLKGKNLRVLGGKPLVAHSIEAAIKCELLKKVVVSTDSSEVMLIAEKYKDSNLEVLLRPKEISHDSSTSLEYINHALDYFAEREIGFDFVVIIQPSSPFTTSEDIDNTLKLIQSPEATSAVSVVKLSHDLNPLKLKVINSRGSLEPYIEDESGRMMDGELPDVYIRNGSVYVFKKETLSKGELFGNECRAYVMPRERSVDINDEFDLKFAEFLLISNASG